MYVHGVEHQGCHIVDVQLIAFLFNDGQHVWRKVACHYPLELGR